MATELLYLQDSYAKTATARVVDVQELNGQTAVILDRTNFYAQGGGQPADQGTIQGPNGKVTVTHVSYNGGDVLHKGTLEGSIKASDEVSLSIDWDRRYQHMQWHTAGHIVDQAVKNVVANSNSVDGNHGIGKKLYIEFTNPITNADIEKIQSQVDQILSEDLLIKAEMISYDELIKREVKLPFDLPTNKPLRIVQIGEYPPMPDGGTQLKTTGENLSIKVTGIQEKDGKYRVMYEVINPNQLPLAKDEQVTDPKPSSTSLKTFTSLLNELKKEFDQDIQNNQLSSDEIGTKYLGKKNGKFKTISVKDLPTEDRKTAGQLLNQLIEYANNEHLAYGVKKKLSQPDQSWVDLTIPGQQPNVGHMHPISQAMEEITRIFERIGFTRVRYPEVDWDWYVFESLNMPPDHPARDEWETFFIDVPDTSKDVDYDMDNPRKRHPSLIGGGKMVLTTHTSNGQVREMERLESQPPIRMINIARCYRRQQDATHTQMFHQFEGLVVDKGINIQHLKGTLDYFAQEFYGPGTKSRIRPFHFQFTEPSFEVDFSCHICDGTGKVKDKETGEQLKCKFCKSGWHEVGGAGMVHPNVLKAGGIDPTKYTGFAFGWGVERTYTLKEGLNIDDIRLLYSGDLKFLEQF
jgi:phenylalanyl-tRNA synthetase alpha chain